jgi:hypothetical protein
MQEVKYPFVYRLDDDIDLHIEHINDTNSTIWFDREDELQIVPREFELYNETKLVEPYQNTQTYIISRYRHYEIRYKKKPIIIIEAWVFACYPPIPTVNNNIWLIEN